MSELNRIQTKLVEGEWEKGREILSSVIVSSIRSTSLAKWFRLCWQLEVPERGLSALVLAAKKDNGKEAEATFHAALCLARAKAFQTAHHWIDSVSASTSDAQLKSLFHGIVFAWERDYPNAVNSLRKGLSLPHLDSDLRLWGQLCLSESLTDARMKLQAEYGLRGVAHDALREQHLGLLNRIHLWQGWHFLWNNQLTKLRALVRQVQTSLTGPVQDTQIQWQLLAAVAAVGDSERSQEARSQFYDWRNRALEKGLSEWVRAADRFESIHFQLEPLFTHLYMGTPSSCYRTALIEEYPKDFVPPSSYFWNVTGLVLSRRTLNLHQLVSESKQPPKVRERLLALVEVMTRDFYSLPTVVQVAEALGTIERRPASFVLDPVSEIVDQFNKVAVSQKASIRLRIAGSKILFQFTEPIQLEIPLKYSPSKMFRKAA